MLRGGLMSRTRETVTSNQDSLIRHAAAAKFLSNRTVRPTVNRGMTGADALIELDHRLSGIPAKWGNC